MVASTPLAQAPRLAAAQEAEQTPLARRQGHWQRRPLAGEVDAHPAAIRCLRALAVHPPDLTSTGGAAWVPDKRATRGRPPKEAPRPQRQLWRVTWQGHEATAASSARAPRERRFVLATDVLDARHFSDADRRRAYTGQSAVELSCKWAKNPAASAPIFLEPPTRIAALGGVSLSALLVDTRVARHVRKRLVERAETLPHRPAPSQRPTARTVFQLMRHMAVVPRLWAGPRQRQVTTLSPLPLRVSGLLGDESLIDALPRRNSG